MKPEELHEFLERTHKEVENLPQSERDYFKAIYGSGPRYTTGQGDKPTELGYECAPDNESQANEVHTQETSKTR